jgi:hypothetical protein
MSVSIQSPINSFVQFSPTAPPELCIWGTLNFCLPVFADDDVYFQWLINGTELEIDSLCTTDGGGITVSLVNDCEDADLLVFSEKPQRFRLSATQLLYNWSHGLPNFKSSVAVAECFKIKVTIDATPYGYPEQVVSFCSKCLERIASDCFTSVLEYGNDEDAFGFKYCGGGSVQPVSGDETCEPTIVQFVNVPTVDIPYTAQLRAMYGDFPTVQVWIYDGPGQLLNMGITAAFDTYPPTMIHIDNGGPASGVVVIR